jgi:hypothetical protein
MSSRPFRTFSHSVAAAFLILLCFHATSRHANAQSLPVTLELVAPTSGGNKIPTVTWGGWPLILKMTANREIGIGWTDPFEFPVESIGLEARGSGLGFSAIVFEDPDSCLSWADQCGVIDETYLDFRPKAGVGCSEEVESDGVASLVLLADSGEGENGVNLASHFNNVGYELNDVDKKTNVVASMVVPNGMVTPPITTDLCGGDSQALLTEFNANNIATMRAFVVSRTAPAQLSDLNADGVIGARDAELSGFSLLSREVVFRVRTLHQIAEFEVFCPPPPPPPPSEEGLCAGVICSDPFCVACDPSTGICQPRDPLPSDCAPGGGGLTPVPR